MKILYIIIGIIIILILVGYFTFKSSEEIKNILPFLSEKEFKKNNLDFIVTFGYTIGNNTVLILHNKGNVNITTFIVKIDNDIVDYKITSGSLPLNPLRSLYFEIENLCNGKEHFIEVFIKESKVNFTLTKEECEIGSSIQ